MNLQRIHALLGCQFGSNLCARASPFDMPEEVIRVCTYGGQLGSSTDKTRILEISSRVLALRTSVYMSR